jgi:hypothetical protein
MAARRFPPPRTIEENNDACFIARDKNGQALAMSTSKRSRAVDRFSDVENVRKPVRIHLV